MTQTCKHWDPQMGTCGAPATHTACRWDQSRKGIPLCTEHTCKSCLPIPVVVVIPPATP